MYLKSISKILLYLKYCSNEKLLNIILHGSEESNCNNKFLKMFERFNGPVKYIDYYRQLLIPKIETSSN